MDAGLETLLYMGLDTSFLMRGVVQVLPGGEPRIYPYIIDNHKKIAMFYMSQRRLRNITGAREAQTFQRRSLPEKLVNEAG